MSSSRAPSTVRPQVTTAGHSANWAMVQPFSSGVKTAVSVSSRLTSGIVRDGAGTGNVVGVDEVDTDRVCPRRRASCSSHHGACIPKGVRFLASETGGLGGAASSDGVVRVGGWQRPLQSSRADCARGGRVGSRGVVAPGRAGPVGVVPDAVPVASRRSATDVNAAGSISSPLARRIVGGHAGQEGKARRERL